MNFIEIFSQIKKKINKKNKIRKGRGDSSRKGVYGGRGRKGYKSRSGSSQDVTFEGGQTRTIKKIPKFGFKSLYPKFLSINIISFFNAIIKLFLNDNLKQYSLENKIIVNKIFHNKKKVKLLYDNNINLEEITKKLSIKKEIFILDISISSLDKPKINNKYSIKNLNDDLFYYFLKKNKYTFLISKASKKVISFLKQINFKYIIL